MNESNDAVAELLTLTVEVDNYGTRTYRNSSGERHRHHGPAVECANGGKSWWLNDQLHRTTGPAIEYADGRRSWYVDGKKLTEQEFHEQAGPK